MAVTEEKESLQAFPEAEYEITEFFFGKPIPQAVQVSFELDAHGWSRLEQSSEWRNLLEVLASLQKEQKHFVHSARIQGREVTA